MARPGLQQIVLDDFSPGIWDDWQAGGAATAAPQGAAQLTGTYSCLAGPGGGLQPGPKRVSRILEELIDAAGTDKYPPNNEKVHITAFRNASPVWNRSLTDPTAVGSPAPYPDVLAFGFDWYYNAAGGSWHHRQMVRLYKNFLESAPNPALGTVNTFDIADTTSTAATVANLFNGFCGIDLSRSNTANPITIGNPVIAAITMDWLEISTESHNIYPDDQANTTDSTRVMTGLETGGGFAGYTIFGHQDRIVLIGRTVNYGFGPDGEIPTDIISSSAVNDVATVGITASAFVAENPGLFGAWASVNASEAFFVKQQRGGFVLRGDISFPTVVRLPGLAPTYDAINTPAVGYDGAVYYGSRDGVYAWAGGDTSKPVSRQLSGWFWQVPGDNNTFEGVASFLHSKGTFSAFQQYIATPNNYLLDTERGGWWRLTDPTADGERPYCHYDTSAGGFLIGVPAYFDAELPAIADYYDFEQGQRAYQWRSQPLRVSMNRELDFRECDLVLQGQGEVTVTVTGINGHTSSAKFPVDSTDHAVTMKKNLGIHAHDAVVTIFSDSLEDELPAPRVHRVTLGYNQRQTVA